MRAVAMLGVISAPYLTFFNVVWLFGTLFIVIYYVTEPYFFGARWDKAFYLS